MIDILIIGAGTAGLTAAIYGLRAGKKVVVLERMMPGGQIVNALNIENYPGIKEIKGSDFAMNLFEQAKSFGMEYKSEKVEEVTKKLEVKTNKNTYKAKDILIATGSEVKLLGLENEEKYLGKGISTCAICDGHFFKDKDVCVVGGGNTALGDALYLKEYCKTVYLVHRRESFRGDKYLVDKISKTENIQTIMDSEVVALEGNTTLESVTIRNKKTLAEKEISVAGLFEAIGRIPNTNIVEGLVELNANGYIKTDENMETSKKHIYAIGDVREKDLRQLVTAANDGAVAVNSIIEK